MTIVGGIGEIGLHGSVGILNVGEGDTKLSFDPDKPEERKRAAAVVAQMLRMGFAILIEVDDGKGGKIFRRVKKFRADVCEYVITGEATDEPAAATPAGATAAQGAPKPNSLKGRRARAKDVAVPAVHTRAVGVARSAGG